MFFMENVFTEGFFPKIQCPTVPSRYHELCWVPKGEILDLLIIRGEREDIAFLKSVGIGDKKICISPNPLDSLKGSTPL